MAIQTRVNKEWSIRLLIISVAFIGWGFYSVYDGKVGYPNENKLYELTHEYDEATEQWTELPDGEWQANLTAAGFDPDKIRPNKLTYHSPWSINTQFIMAGLCFPVGLVSLVWLIYHGRRAPSVDEQGLKFGSTTVSLESITVIDKVLWASKGIASIRYESDGGSGLYKLDDWKHRGSDELLKYVEQNAPNVKIENDFETEPEEEPQTEDESTVGSA